MDLQQELNAVEQMVREKTAPHVMPTIEASIHAVKESGLERRALQLGETIRDFELPDATGAMVKSLELRSRGPLLIVFYRGGLVWWAFVIYTTIHINHQKIPPSLGVSSWLSSTIRVGPYPRGGLLVAGKLALKSNAVCSWPSRCCSRRNSSRSGGICERTTLVRPSWLNNRLPATSCLDSIDKT